MISLIFRPRKIQKKSIFGPFRWKLLRITMHGQSFRPREAYNSAKWPQENPFRTGKKKFINFAPNNSKSLWFRPKKVKMTRARKITKINRRKFYWWKSIQNGPKDVLKWKSPFRKKFAIMIFLWRHSRFSKYGVICLKMVKTIFLKIVLILKWMWNVQDFMEWFPDCFSKQSRNFSNTLVFKTDRHW